MFADRGGNNDPQEGPFFVASIFWDEAAFLGPHWQEKSSDLTSPLFQPPLLGGLSVVLMRCLRLHGISAHTYVWLWEMNL